MQEDLFSGEFSEATAEAVDYDLADARIRLYPHFFSEAQSRRLFNTLSNPGIIAWEQHSITLYGRQTPIPRLSALYGVRDKTYTYSGIRMHPRPWENIEALQTIKKAVETPAEVEFTSVLMNLYRDGRDAVGWHQDNEPELGANPVIASVSLGDTRLFQMRHIKRKTLPRLDIPLNDGSLLLMRGPTQHFWKHQVPRTAKNKEPRINLTFRVIL